MIQTRKASFPVVPAMPPIEKRTKGGTPAATQKAPFQSSARTIWPELEESLISLAPVVFAILPGFRAPHFRLSTRSGPKPIRHSMVSLQSFLPHVPVGQDRADMLTCVLMSQSKHVRFDLARKLLTLRKFVS
jgi:hypothetical protein